MHVRAKCYTSCIRVSAFIHSCHMLIMGAIFCNIIVHQAQTPRAVVEGLVNESIAVKAEQLVAVWTAHNHANLSRRPILQRNGL